VAAAFGVLQVPVLLAAEHLGDAAAEVDRDVLEQAAGDGAHARYADPAGLFVREGEFAITVVVQLRLPLFGPAAGDPVLHLLDETPVAGGEVLGAEVSAPASLRLLAMRPPLPWPLSNRCTVPGFLQGLGGGQTGDAGPDDGDRYCHDGLFKPCCEQTTLSGKPVQCNFV
jgi:hypothetical protein